MSNILPDKSDWQMLNRLKAYSQRDTESARLYNEFEQSFKWDDLKFSINGKVGLKGIFDNILIPAIYDDVVTTQDAIMGYLYPVAVVELNKKYALALRDGTGRNLCPFIYDEIEELNNDTYCVERNGKFGVVNSKGQDIFPCVFDSAYTEFVHLPLDVSVVLEKDGKFGFVLRYTIFGYSGTPIIVNKYIKPMYEAWMGRDFDPRLGTFTGDLRVKLNGKWGYLDVEAGFTENSSKSYIGDEFRTNETSKERRLYNREKWWKEHPEEDRDIYYEDSINFEPF